MWGLGFLWRDLVVSSSCEGGPVGCGADGLTMVVCPITQVTLLPCRRSFDPKLGPILLPSGESTFMFI